MTSTIKTISIEVLAEKLGGNYWTKGEIKRIYLDRGYNTKKMTTKTYVYQLQDGAYAVKCTIDCPSQNSSWIRSQEEQVMKSVLESIDELIEEFGTEIENPQIAIQAALAQEEQVQGYFMEWKEVRVAINKFGKLATRKRMFVTTFKGPKSKAHPRLIELTDAEMAAALESEKKETAYEYSNEPNFKITVVFQELNLTNLPNLVGKKIQWKAPAYRSNAPYGGIAIINEVIEGRKPIKSNCIEGDSLDFAFIDHDFTLAYSDGDRTVTFKIIEDAN